MKYTKIAKDEIDIYLTNSINEEWKKKRIKNYDLLDDVWKPVAFRSQEQGYARYGIKIPVREVHRVWATEDYFQRNFERAMLIRPSFDPSLGVPLDLFLQIDLKRTDWHGDIWESPISPTEHQGRRLAKARRHSFDKNKQKEFWIEDGGKAEDFDIFDLSNWDYVNTMPFEDFDGGEVSLKVQDPKSEQDVEQEVEVLIDAERYAMFMATLTDEERQMFLYAKQGKNHQWISDILGIGVDRKTIGRRVKKIEKRLRAFLFGETDTGSEDNGN